MQTLNISRLVHFLEPHARRSTHHHARPRADLRSQCKANLPAFTLTDNPLAPASTVFIDAQLAHFAEPSAAPAPISAAAKDALFRNLVKEYSASLYYFVLKRVGHPDDAADIAQQAFVEAACSFTSFRGEAELSTWIFGIATNLARNHIGRAPQHRHRFETDEVLDTCESADLLPCESLSQRQGLELVSQAIDLMSPEMSQALILVVIDELSYEDAASGLDVPVGTVRSRVSRGRAAVRQHLTKAGYLANHA
ncbi:MAG: RNA polymerase sigma factor [Ramlibacter sp.]|nr:RNA polymerase sigma factor [Ramlibacter sp.]